MIEENSYFALYSLRFEPIYYLFNFDISSLHIIYTNLKILESYILSKARKKVEIRIGKVTPSNFILNNLNFPY